ncbi:MFS transporter [Salipaludibacillus neizhouensis]|uniref:MFS transporter n=1 Tax=Salipaludibacillus neizhouensis TaxID=885475 RepID=A0A3A9KBF2_9BACI|nr:MFS transporter [Salipaludibacillus neizhouensis]
MMTSNISLEVKPLKLLYIIIAVAFIDTFSQLPIIAPFSSSLGATPLLIGIIIGMYSFSNIIGNILSGIWTDKIGPKKVLCIGMLTVGVIVFFYSVVTTPYQLLFVRFLHGIAGGFIVPAAFTFFGSKDKRKSNGKTMAFSGASVGTAAILGPAAGALISARLGFDWLFYIIASAMIFFGLLAVFFLKEKPNTGEATSIKLQEIKPVTKTGFTLFKKPLLHAYISIFLLLFTLGVLTYSLPLKVEALLISSEITGILLSTFGTVAILFFLLPTNKLFDKLNKSLLMNYGLATIALALFLLSLSSTLIHMVFAMVVYGIGFALLFPSTSATVIEFSKEKERGKAFGVFYSCFSLGVVGGSFFAGSLALTPSSSFLVSALLLVIIVSAIFISKKNA